MEILLLLRDLGIFSIAMYFIQLVLTKSADRKFENYKLELNHKTREFQSTLDSQLEIFRAELNFKNYKSTQVYEKQLNVIVDLHKKLTKLNREMQIMTAIVKPIFNDAEKEEIDRIKNAGEAYNDFMIYYYDNLIFIPKDTTVKLNIIRDDYWSSYNDYTFGRNYGIRDKFTFEQSKQASERVRDKIQPAVDQLLTDFKSLIGVER